MDPEIGKLFTFPDGSTGYWNGGDVKDPASWSDQPPAVVPSTGRQRMDAEAKRLAGISGDVPTRIGDPSIAPMMAGLAVGAIPAGGFLGREAVAGASMAVQGAMAAEPGQRIKGAVTGGLLGLGAGALAEGAGGLLNAIARRGGAGAGPRLADALTKTAGVSEDLNTTRRAAKAAVDEARSAGYSLFEAKPPVSASTLAGSNLPSTITSKLPRGDVPFTALQDLRASLRATGNKSEANLLSEFMQEQYPGLSATDKIYGAAMETGRTIKKASAVSNKSASDIAWMRENLPAGQDATARQVMVQKRADVMRMTDQKAGAFVKSLMDQGPDGAARVREYFPQGPAGDASYNEFQRIIGLEKSAAKVGAAAKTTLKAAGLGLFGYAAIKKLGGLFDSSASAAPDAPAP